MAVIHRLYAMIRHGTPWTHGEPRLNSENQPIIPDILHELAIRDHGNVEFDEEEEEEEEEEEVESGLDACLKESNQSLSTFSAVDAQEEQDLAASYEDEFHLPAISETGTSPGFETDTDTVDKELQSWKPFSVTRDLVASEAGWLLDDVKLPFYKSPDLLWAEIV